MPRILVVQCCHLPQFLHVVERLRERHADWTIDAFVVNHPQVHFYLKIFPYFNEVHFLNSKTLPIPGSYDRILFPLLNRGYLRIKKTGASLPIAGFESDYDGNLKELKKPRLFGSVFVPLHKPTPAFIRYLKNFPHRPLGEKILLFESCHPSLIAKTERHWKSLIPANAQVIRVTERNLSKIWKASRRELPDGAIVFFSGEKGFARMKLLPFLLRLSRIAVFNENGHYFYASARSLARFAYERFRYGYSLPRPAPRVLFLQTETSRYVTEAVNRLKRNLYPRSEILLVCREEDNLQFQHWTGIGHVLSYFRGEFRGNLRLLRKIRGFDPDLICAIFSGRPIFRKQKLFFLLFPTRRHLAFNAGLDCYVVTPRTFIRLGRKEPLLFDTATATDATRALLIQSAGEAETLKALEVLRNPRVAPRVRVSVFCSEDKRGIFEGAPGVEQVFSYDARKLRQVCSTLWQLLRMRPDVVAGIFSGQPTFRKQKMLFFLLPARSRLAFNENLDCFYLNWRNFHQVFPEIRDPALAPLRAYTRQVLKGLLFLPRFFYLVMWVTVMKARRAYTQAGK